MCRLDKIFHISNLLLTVWWYLNLTGSEGHVIHIYSQETDPPNKPVERLPVRDCKSRAACSRSARLNNTSQKCNAENIRSGLSVRHHLKNESMLRKLTQKIKSVPNDNKGSSLILRDNKTFTKRMPPGTITARSPHMQQLAQAFEEAYRIGFDWLTKEGPGLQMLVSGRDQELPDSSLNYHVSLGHPDRQCPREPGILLKQVGFDTRSFSYQVVNFRYDDRLNNEACKSEVSHGNNHMNIVQNNIGPELGDSIVPLLLCWKAGMSSGLGNTLITSLRDVKIPAPSSPLNIPLRYITFSTLHNQENTFRVLQYISLNFDGHKMPQDESWEYVIPETVGEHPPHGETARQNLAALFGTREVNSVDRLLKTYPQSFHNAYIDAINFRFKYRKGTTVLVSATMLVTLRLQTEHINNDELLNLEPQQPAPQNEAEGAPTPDLVMRVVSRHPTRHPFANDLTGNVATYREDPLPTYQLAMVTLQLPSETVNVQECNYFIAVSTAELHLVYHGVECDPPLGPDTSDYTFDAVREFMGPAILQAWARLAGRSPIRHILFLGLWSQTAEKVERYLALGRPEPGIPVSIVLGDPTFDYYHQKFLNIGPEGQAYTFLYENPEHIDILGDAYISELHYGKDSVDERTFILLTLRTPGFEDLQSPYVYEYQSFNTPAVDIDMHHDPLPYPEDLGSISPNDRGPSGDEGEDGAQDKAGLPSIFNLSDGIVRKMLGLEDDDGQRQHIASPASTASGGGESGESGSPNAFEADAESAYGDFDYMDLYAPPAYAYDNFDDLYAPPAGLSVPVAGAQGQVPALTLISPERIEDLIYAGAHLKARAGFNYLVASSLDRRKNPEMKPYKGWDNNKPSGPSDDITNRYDYNPAPGLTTDPFPVLFDVFQRGSGDLRVTRHILVDEPSQGELRTLLVNPKSQPQLRVETITKSQVPKDTEQDADSRLHLGILKLPEATGGPAFTSIDLADLLFATLRREGFGKKLSVKFGGIVTISFFKVTEETKTLLQNIYSTYEDLIKPFDKDGASRILRLQDPFFGFKRVRAMNDLYAPKVSDPPESGESPKDPEEPSAWRYRNMSRLVRLWLMLLGTVEMAAVATINIRHGLEIRHDNLDALREISEIAIQYQSVNGEPTPRLLALFKPAFGGTEGTYAPNFLQMQLQLSSTPSTKRAYREGDAIVLYQLAPGRGSTLNNDLELPDAYFSARVEGQRDVPNGLSSWVIGSLGFSPREYRRFTPVVITSGNAASSAEIFVSPYDVIGTAQMVIFAIPEHWSAQEELLAKIYNKALTVVAGEMVPPVGYMQPLFVTFLSSSLSKSSNKALVETLRVTCASRIANLPKDSHSIEVHLSTANKVPKFPMFVVLGIPEVQALSILLRKRAIGPTGPWLSRIGYVTLNCNLVTVICTIFLRTVASGELDNTL